MDDQTQREFDKLDREDRLLHKRISDQDRAISKGFEGIQLKLDGGQKQMLDLLPHVAEMAVQVSANEKMIDRQGEEFNDKLKELKIYLKENTDGLGERISNSGKALSRQMTTVKTDIEKDIKEAKANAVKDTAAVDAKVEKWDKRIWALIVAVALLLLGKAFDYFSGGG